MADIQEPIVYDDNIEQIISNKKQSTNFSHLSWGDDDLLPVRRVIRDYYKEKQNGNCAYCKQVVSLVSVHNCHVEHIVPKSLHLDFIFTPNNLCVICADCNQIKREQEVLGVVPQTMTNGATRKLYPRSKNSFLIVHPHFDDYDDHILIVDGLYVDKSKKGHFTIGACKLNRKLHVFGWESETMENDKLSHLMNQFLDEDDASKQLKTLEELKKLLSD